MIFISPSDQVFVLTGAGVSAESGVPTFRGVGGLWQGYRIEEVASPEAWRRDPRLVWQFYSMRRRVAADKHPNPGHYALARLEEELADRLFLCTQNVDSLHEQAGSRRVVHMHGRLFQSRCDSCSRPPFEDDRAYEAELPRCYCGGRIRPHICWFGEMPFELDAICGALEQATLQPAASFVAQARRPGKSLCTVYVGPEEPANRALFDQCFLGKSGELLPTLFRLS